MDRRQWKAEAMEGRGVLGLIGGGVGRYLSQGGGGEGR